jgi:glucose-1-phosphate thymidylyltransferase
MNQIEKAVILARGLGTRMQKPDTSAKLDRDQTAVAGSGVKAMIPIGRPFLDYVLSALADAGFRRVCLVIGPEHQQMRDYYAVQAPPRRIRIDFAIQEKPLGTADAVLAASEFVGKDLFLAINSDNYYPPEVLKNMRDFGQAGVALFDRDRLVAESNIPEDRVLKFSVASMNQGGYLERIFEKPGQDVVCRLGSPLYVSMNCWIFSPSIFEACRRIRPSARGELELTDAVQYTIDVLKERLKALIFRTRVLDLSSRSDIAAVAERLRDLNPDP